MSSSAKIDMYDLIQVFLDSRELFSPKLIKTIEPTHGNCCTCQDCGYDHDSCICRSNRLLNTLYTLAGLTPPKGGSITDWTEDKAHRTEHLESLGLQSYWKD